VSVESEGPSITLSVLDTGTGIPPEDLPHIFDRFYRGGPSRAKTKAGTGLGLSIAKQLVEAHGGEISVASTLGRGTMFTVRLSAPGPGTASAR
jgi:two-component system sensor histidine kinase BaeS